MLVVLSQFSFLKWLDKKLYFDKSFDLQEYLKKLQPYILPPQNDRLQEFLNLGAMPNVSLSSPLFESLETPIDIVFTEGKRSRVTHLKIERSPLLRKIYFERNPVVQCNMCELLPQVMYPWTDNILEIHHLLPLSSGIAVTLSGTSLEDIVSLCPNCHRSVHVFYKSWLEQMQVNDFKSKHEAREIYLEAKKAIA
ncbi:MAG: HNH endonuclease [Saprospiraceae bacterium]|nr:HNH endonuclease [Saprospiraceae bacterium]MCF8249868.1 HNH endonuclease [Saprospiraceae bacterium]MCF8279462.1 HNH endonuclease [Bacteroidales bacterium]MCF8311698.1 HNH endonuclease [Saprospiraceae bacterium]MCF8440265.1 HNH endonuclease [Saprospiraceae bacterium]